jgi:hypothetical protein
VLIGKVAYPTMEADVWQFDAERNSQFFRNPIPAIQAGLDFTNVVITQAGIQGCNSRNMPGDDLVTHHLLDRVLFAGQNVIVAQLCLGVAAFEARRVIGGGVRRYFRTV